VPTNFKKLVINPFAIGEGIIKMPTPNENIVAGLQKHRSKITGAYVGPYDGPTGPNLASLAGAPKSLAEIITLKKDSRARLLKLKVSVAFQESDIAKKTEAIKAEWNRNTDIPASARKKYAEEAITRYRKERVAASDEADWADVAALGTAEARMKSIKDHWNATSMLAREGLGTPELAFYLERVANSGPAELTNLGREAIITNNRLLGAAVMTKLGSLNKSNRDLVPFTSIELAETLLATDLAQVREAMRVTINNAQDGINTRKAYESTRPQGGLSKIKLALDRAEETGVLDTDGSEGE
jgi:hypothetical protein